MFVASLPYAFCAQHQGRCCACSVCLSSACAPRVCTCSGSRAHCSNRRGFGRPGPVRRPALSRRLFPPPGRRPARQPALTVTPLQDNSSQGGDRDQPISTSTSTQAIAVAMAGTGTGTGATPLARASPWRWAARRPPSQTQTQTLLWLGLLAAVILCAAAAGTKSVEAQTTLNFEGEDGGGSRTRLLRIASCREHNHRDHEIKGTEVMSVFGSARLE